MKIGIIDAGVDQAHPFFDPAGYAMPAGFPKGQTALHDGEGDRRARVPAAGRDRRRACVAFDRRRLEPRRPTSPASPPGNADTPARGGRRVSGVAPRAYIGNYKVFVQTDADVSPNANSPEIVAAIEAAVADGMDVINLSGGEPEIEPSRDIVALALDAAAAAGVVPVVAAGNDFDDFGAGSLSSPGTRQRAITVGAVDDRAAARTRRRLLVRRARRRSRSG